MIYFVLIFMHNMEYGVRITLSPYTNIQLFHHYFWKRLSLFIEVFWLLYRKLIE